MTRFNNREHRIAKDVLYGKFQDGWDFSPDRGNSLTRAEVFTPKYLVDMMLSDSGMFCNKAIYDGKYDTLSDDETLKAVQATVIESAVGTANFLSEIMWHKMCYAHELSNRSREYSYDYLICEAVASVYANDISVGSLQIAKSRLFEGEPVLSDKNTKFWVDQIRNNTDEPDESLITSEVAESLADAHEAWGEFLKPEGVVFTLYRKHSGYNLAGHLKDVVRSIADRNFIAYDSITEETVGAVSGWRNIVWESHEVTSSGGRIDYSSSPIALALQLGVEELKSLIAERDSVMDKISERQVRNYDRKILKLKEKLRELPGSELDAFAPHIAL